MFMKKYFIITIIMGIILIGSLSILLVHEYTVKVIMFKRDVIDTSGYLLYEFYPCKNKLNERFLLIRLIISADKPVTIVILDYEQYIERYGRGDLYGYLAYKSHVVNEEIIEVEYPKGMPCWPIYIEIRGSYGTNICMKIYYKFIS